MEKLPHMVDMRRDSGDESHEGHYPYGLCISFGDDELKKLGLKPEEANVGDLLHMHSLAKITSISKHDSEEGAKHRVEMQITHVIDSPESEDGENREADKKMRPRRSLYR